LKSIYSFDSLGNGKYYKEYSDEGWVIYYCVYEYKEICRKLYRIEHDQVFYEPNILQDDFYMYMCIRKENGEDGDLKRHEFGIRRRYNSDRKESVTDYGDIK